MSTRVFALRFGRLGLCLVYLLAIAVLPLIKIEKAEAGGIIYKGVQTATAASATSLTINKPSGVIENDVMIAVVAIDKQNPNITAPSGWTQINETTYGGTHVSVETYWKKAGASEGSSYAFTGDAGNTRWAGGITHYRGVDGTTPIDGTGSDGTPASGTTATADGFTTTSSQSYNVAVFATDQADVTTFSTPTGMNERIEVGADNGGTDAVTVALDDAWISNTTTVPNRSSTIGASGNWVAHQFTLKPASTTHMLLFWDGTDVGGSPISLPSGWSFVTEAEGKFLRGDAPANFGKTGGSSTHGHTMLTPTLGTPSASVAANIGGTGQSATGHTHGMPTNTAVAASSSPSFKTLRLIRYDAGIPNTIPAGAIAIFDDSPGIPSSGWTRQASQDAFMAKIDSTAGTTGGSDTHAHNVTWSGDLTAASGEIGRFCLLCSSNSAALTHTHTVSTTQTTADSSTAIPPYIQPLLAKADSDTPVLSIGLTAMFDGTPGGGWVVRSESGGPYYQKFLRPNTTYSQAGGGTTGHTHTGTGGAKTSGAAVGNGLTNNNGNGISASGHTHVITPVFQAFASDPLYTGDNEYFLPPYYSMVVAEKVNFIFNHYAWYDDNNAVDVTSRYSGLDVAQDTHINPVPAGFNPPDLGQELRLRIQVLVNNSSLSDAEMQFRLQYAEDTSTSLTASTCTNAGLSWTDVGNSGGGQAWTYVGDGGGAHPSDGAAITTSIMTPTSDTLHRYVRSNSAGTNTGPVAAGETMEWDYHIINNAAAPATQYRFRLVEDSGILLSQYGYGSPTVTPVCPTLTTRPYPVHQLRHGNFFDSTGSEKGFFWAD